MTGKGQRSQESCSPGDHKELDTTDRKGTEQGGLEKMENNLHFILNEFTLNLGKLSR